MISPHTRIKKVWLHRDTFNDYIKATKEASSFDISIIKLIKLGDSKRVKAGIQEILNRGYVIDAHACDKCLIINDKGVVLKMTLRADGIPLDYESPIFKSRTEAENHADYIYRNTLEIVYKKLELKEAV